MPDYTLANLKQVKDLAPEFGMAPDLEARFARGTLELEQSGITYFRFAPGVRSPFGHRHKEQEEIYLVVSGSLTMRVGDDDIAMGPWDALRVAPEAVRGFVAGTDGVEVVAYGAQDSDAREGESEQLPEFWDGE